VISLRAAALERDPHARTAPASLKPCLVSVEHEPTPIVTQAHHTFPKYLQMLAYDISDEAVLLADPRFDGTLVDVCGTHHDSIHAVIRTLLAQPGEGLSYHVSKKVFDLAVYAIEKLNAARGG